MTSRPARGVASSPHCTACGVPRCTASSSQPRTRSPLLYVSAALTLSFVSPPAIVEYPLPRPKAFPHDPAVGADGIVWYTDQANSYIGRLDPATGKVSDYATPTPTSGPHGIIVAPDGGVWYTGNFTARRGRLDPATGAIKEFPLPSGARAPHTPLYHAGKVWFTAQGANLYGVLDAATGSAKLSPGPTRGARLSGLVAAPDGMIWMALFGTNQLGRIDPADGALKIFPLPASGARPRRLIVDATGIVWYSDYARGKLGRLDPATGQVRDYPCPGGDASQPYGIAGAEPRGRPVREGLPAIAPTLEPLLGRILETGEPALNIEVTGETPAQPGITRFWRASYFPLASDGIGAIVVEDTARRHAERPRRRSGAAYRAILERGPYGIYRSSLEGRFLKVNPALVAMLGYDNEAQVLALDLGRDVYVDAAQRARNIELARTLERISGVQVQWKRRDGHHITVRLSGRAVRSEGGGDLKGFEMMAEDVTEQRTLEPALQQAP